MITEKQIQWVVPVFNEAYSILDKILDLGPMYEREYRVDEEYFKGKPYDFEFFYDEDDGLYKITNEEHGPFSLNVFGKTKREIIQHIVDECIKNDASLHYASKKFWEIHPNSPLPCRKSDEYADQYYKFVEERMRYCHDIVEPYIDSMEYLVFPSNPEIETPKPIKQGKYMSLYSKGDKFIVKVSIPNVKDFYHCYMGVLREENGQHYGVSYYINQEKSTIDISRFYEGAEFLSLKAEIIGTDRLLLERLLERIDI